MKQCFCGCGAKAELEDFEDAEGSPVDGNAFDMIKICTKKIKGQIIPRGHMQFVLEGSESGNGTIIYNRYGDIIHVGEFCADDCPCLGHRTPI